MIPNIKFYHDTRKTDSEGKGLINLVIRHKGKVAYISTGVSVKPEEWRGNEIIMHPQRASLNRYIQLMKIQAEDILHDILRDNATEITAKALKERITATIKPGSAPRKGAFVSRFVKFMNAKDGRTRQIYKATLNHINKFDPKADTLKFEDITVAWLKQFDLYMMKTSPSANARNIHFRNIRAVFNDAIDDEVITCYPFRKFKIRPVPTRKRSFSKEKLQKIFTAPIDNSLEIYRDVFKLTFLLIGINFIDLCHITEIKDGRIEYTRAKTKKPYSVKVEPEALEIINRHRGQKFLLDFLDNYASYRVFYTAVSRGLHRIAETLGLDELTTYWARHSWATTAAALDIPKETIAAALGHGGNTVTDIYIDFDRRKVDEANRRVIDCILKEE